MALRLRGFDLSTLMIGGSLVSVRFTAAERNIVNVLYHLGFTDTDLKLGLEESAKVI